MYFWELQSSQSVAMQTTTGTYTYEMLVEAMNKHTLQSLKKQLVLLLCENTIETVVTYLAALRSHHAVMLVSSDTNEKLLEKIIAQYQPKWIIGRDDVHGYERDQNKLVRLTDVEVTIHQDLAILLSTSGTTGSQKFVRLSYDNIQSNAQAIADYLQLDKNERAIMNLPVSYSYGLSILNSHLQVGAAILLTDMSVMDKSFWQFVQQQRATSLPGVPFTFQMLQRIGFLKMELSHLTTLTQAGGRLNEKFVRAFGEYAQTHDKRFYVMYGQTEASPRISYIPPEKVLEKASSIGIAIPGGELSVDADTTELIYKGPNVMMGYAECLADLAKGDEMQGVLHTGDTATVDEDGYFTITGRLKRFIKLFGLRINLDDVEKKLEFDLHIAVACTGNDDKLVVVIEQQQAVDEVKEAIERYYKLHKTAYKIVVLDAIPRLANGKTDYMALKGTV